MRFEQVNHLMYFNDNLQKNEQKRSHGGIKSEENEQKWSQRTPKWNQLEAKSRPKGVPGSQREPKGSQREPKGSPMVVDQFSFQNR